MNNADMQSILALERTTKTHNSVCTKAGCLKHVMMTMMETNCVKPVVYKGKLTAGSGRTCVSSLHGLSVCTEGVLSCSDWTPSKSTHPERWCQQQPTYDQNFLAASKHIQLIAWFAVLVSRYFTAAADAK